MSGLHKNIDGERAELKVLKMKTHEYEIKIKGGNKKWGQKPLKISNYGP